MQVIMERLVFSSLSVLIAGFVFSFRVCVQLWQT